MAKKATFSVTKVAFLQALGIVGYCALVAGVMGNIIKSNIDEVYAPLIVLSIFSTSALICAIITFYYPFILVTEQKNIKKAVAVIIQMALWLVAMVAIILIMLMNIR